jgi:Arc/MetJ-type ribon-helix-helix transcriptional regulator
MDEDRTAALQVDVPVRLHNEMRLLVESGWFRDIDELILDTLRRFLDSHRGDLMERFVRQDVEWGLRGPG